MSKFRYLLIFLFFIIITNDVFSQMYRKFTLRTDKYIIELTDFFNDIDNAKKRKEGKEFIEMFSLVYDSDALSEEQKKMIIRTSNNMLKRKMKQFPQFHKYLSTIISFTKTDNSEESFVNWHKSLKNLITKSSSSKFLNFLDICDKLFISNTLYKSNTVEWRSSSAEYSFELEGKKIKIIFPALNLTCYAKNDSSIIYNTKGVYYPIDYTWIGEGGKVNWLRAGFSEDKVFAQLSKYKLKVKYSKYIADSVSFYHKGFFNYALFGRINEKILANSSPEKATYPRFNSYDKRITINELFEDIDYNGGFSLYGSKIVGTGSDDEDAILTFKKDNKKFVSTASKTYIIKKDRILSQRSSVTVFWENDSIYHPGLQMTYMDNKKVLSLYRDREGLARSPFFNSYHQIDMYVEEMNWKMDEPKIDLKMIEGVGSVSEATFESNNYYSRYRYDKIQGIDRVHPLQVIKNFSDKNKTKDIYLEELSNYMGLPKASVKKMLLNLSNMGFLIYDLDEERVIIKERLYNYLNSKMGKTDYDVIQFYSVTSGKNNATLNLLNFDLKLSGVDKVFLSDSQLVFIYPKNEELVLKKNRDFTFDGKIHAGLFDFYGKECYFDYDRFKIELPIIDSMSFKVKSFERTPGGYAYLVTVKTVIEDMSGNVLLDHPKNKSGLKPFHEYPIFNSKKNSFVYYDKKCIQKGIYTRDRFYYRLDPFTIDSLDNFATEGLEFKGYLASSDIFPDIDQPLKVMPDYSLGFVHITPVTGYDIYGGKGKYSNEINLSNKGLRGDGSLKYLTSTSKSDDFLFFPDSTLAELQYYEIKEQIADVEYPSVKAEDVYEKWFPYNDLMTVKKILKPITMYNAQANFHGKLDLTPSILTGGGNMEINDAEIESKLFKFKQHTIDADTSDFRLRAQFSDINLGSDSLSGYELLTYNYKAHIDFEKRMGEFESNGGASKVEFTVNQYICFIDKFEWYMDKDELMLSSKEYAKVDYENMSMENLADMELSGSKFTSIHPEQDSLTFYAQKAKYNRNSNTIYAYEVQYIKVADASIFPNDGKVTILKYAEIETLEDAKILANNATKYHKIYNANVNILGKKKYNGRGVYNYKDELGEIQNIYFGKIEVDTTAQTYATGEINESADFTLSPDFDFMGDVNLIASREFLKFDGGCRIKHNCDTIERSWMKFNAEINPLEIAIPVSTEPKDIMNNDLFASVMFSTDTTEVYSAFLSRSGRKTDSKIISADGILIYDKINSEYRISNPDKLKQRTLPGNYLSLNRNSCVTYGEGKINIGNNFGQVNVETYGNVKHFNKNDFTQFDLVVTFDFLFSEDALEIMTDNLGKYYELDAVSINRETYNLALGEIVGDEEAQKLISEIALNNGFKKMPSELKRTFFFTDVQMKWNSKTETYVSTGKIGIGSIGKNQINKYVDGKIEIERTKTGNNFIIYLEFSETDWYYFNYQKVGRMMVLGKDIEFNKIIRETKPDNRKLDTKGGKKPYQYIPATLVSKKRFLKKYNKK